MTISWFEISMNNSWYVSKLTNRKFYNINELYEYILLNWNFWKSILQLPRFIELLKYSYRIGNKQDCANAYHGNLFYSYSTLYHTESIHNYSTCIYIYSMSSLHFIYTLEFESVEGNNSQIFPTSSQTSRQNTLSHRLCVCFLRQYFYGVTKRRKKTCLKILYYHFTFFRGFGHFSPTMELA